MISIIALALALNSHPSAGIQSSSEPWAGNHLGLSNDIPAPWSPMTVTGTPGAAGSAFAVHCWGRDFIYTSGFLPVQITSQGKPLLSGPISLSLRDGDDSFNWSYGPSQVQKHGGTSVDISGDAVGRSGATTVKVHATTHIEYDGVAEFSLSLSGLPAGSRNRLLLQIPVVGDVARLKHRWSREGKQAHYDFGVSGSLPSRSGVVDSGPFVPYIWMGDEDRGLFWFCESAQAWPNWNNPDAWQVVRTSKSAVLKLNLQQPGQSGPRDWLFSFGLQPTPVKPMTRRPEQFRIQPAAKANLAVLWATDTTSYFGYLQPKDPEGLRRGITTRRSQGVKSLVYHTPLFLAPGTPEFRRRGTEWLGDPHRSTGEARPNVSTSQDARLEMMDPSNPSYQDFVAWQVSNMLRSHDVDGFYQDNTQAFEVGRKGRVWLDQKGNAHPTYPIIATRNLYRRIYKASRDVKPDAFILAHVSGAIVTPILGYVDAYLDGEQYRWVKKPYPEVLSPATFRAEFMGRQFGVLPFFLPQLDTEERSTPEPTRSMMALLLLHNVTPWPIWCSVATVNQALSALDAFGIQNAEFVPYYSDAPLARASAPDIYVSAYRKGNETLLVISNLGDRTASANIVLANSLGSRATSFPGASTPIPLSNRTLSVQLPAYDYRFVLVKK